LVKNLALTVVDYCVPPPVRLAAYCVAATSLIGAFVAFPNPITIGSALHIVTEISEQC